LTPSGVTFRLAVAGLGHETNTYADDALGTTGLDSFSVLRGEHLLAVSGQNTCIAGMIDRGRELDLDLVPTYWAYCNPSGTIEAETYQTLKHELLEALRAAMPFDALAIELHGAAVAIGTDDVEGDLGAAIREIVGDIPVVGALDLHGNVSDAMGERYDALLGCHLYPHTDLHERGVEAVDLIARMLDGDVRPITHVEHLPMLLPTSTTDPGHPAHRMNELCAEIEARPGVVDCTVFHGFPYTDTPLVGVHVVVTTDGDDALARACGREVGAWIWQHREEFRPEVLEPAVAVKLAQQADAFPVVMNDTSDNPGGGTPGDATHVLRAFLDADLQDACFAMIKDAETVQQAIEAGVGSTIDVRLGGKHDDLHGDPIESPAYVHSISDGNVTLTGPMLQGVTLHLGPMVRLRIGTSTEPAKWSRSGVDVIVHASGASQTFDPEVFLLHGIDVRRYRYVGLKSSQHFRAGFGDLAGQIITADSPGLTSQRVDVFTHARPPGPLWPVDPSATYS
jgi:microcystin degradation protein MlrC